jgi:hypothetical protein
MMAELARHLIHYSLHLLAPAAIAFLFFRDRWKKAWILMLLTMLVDVDHVFSDPIFDPNRCSIGFHVLHSYPAIIIYGIAAVLAPRNTVLKISGVGLTFHMFTDWLDCWLAATL